MEKLLTPGLPCLFALVAGILASGCGRDIKHIDPPPEGFTSLVVGSSRPVLNNSFNLMSTLADAGNELASVVMPLAAPTANLMVFANSSGFGSGRLYFGPGDYADNTVTTKTWTLPNGGPYKFSMIGYDVTAMGGAPKCALGSLDAGTPGDGVFLTGGTRVITFDSAVGCGAGTAFKQTANTGFKVTVCSSSTAISGLTDLQTCTDGAGIASPAINAVRIQYTEQDEFTMGNVHTTTPGLGSTAIRSACLPLTSGVTANFAYGIAGTADVTKHVHFKTEVLLFTAADCSLPVSPNVYTFNSGLVAGGLGDVASGGSGAFPEPSTLVDGTAASGKARWVEASAGGSAMLFLK